MRTLNVIATQLVDETHAADIDVAGEYAVTIIDDGKLTDGQAACAALDSFHTKIPVKVLDDFEFIVVDPETGKVMDQDPDQEAYSLADMAAVVERL